MILGIRDLPGAAQPGRPDVGGIDMVILQCAGAGAVHDRLADPSLPAACHYVVDADGNVFRLVPEDRLAGPPGAASWRGRRGIDGRAIGIALVPTGHGLTFRGQETPEFGVLQLAAACDLCLDILSRHAVPARNFIGLADAAPDRSTAPGEMFDWEGLARNDIGLWPAEVPDLGTGGAVRDAASLRDVRAALAHIGYDVAAEGALDPALASVLRAFQRHWRQEAVTGQADAGTLARLLALARMCG